MSLICVVGPGPIVGGPLNGERQDTTEGGAFWHIVGNVAHLYAYNFDKRAYAHKFQINSVPRWFRSRAKKEGQSWRKPKRKAWWR